MGFAIFSITLIAGVILSIAAVGLWRILDAIAADRRWW